MIRTEEEPVKTLLALATVLVLIAGTRESAAQDQQSFRTVVGKGYEPSDELAREIQDFCKGQTAPYKYPRRIEFIEELPKTTSGKIRRVELRQREKV